MLSKENLSAEEERASGLDVAGAKPSLLVVEDDAPLCRVLSCFLGTRYDLRFCPNAEAALKMLGIPGAEHPHEDTAGSTCSWRPDLIVCDIMLPGMNGLRFHQLVQRRDPTGTVPFLFISALMPSVRLLPLIRPGLDAYLSKPFELLELDRLTQIMLRRSTGASRVASA